MYWTLVGQLLKMFVKKRNCTALMAAATAEQTDLATDEDGFTLYQRSFAPIKEEQHGGTSSEEDEEEDVEEDRTEGDDGEEEGIGSQGPKRKRAKRTRVLRMEYRRDIEHQTMGPVVKFQLMNSFFQEGVATLQDNDFRAEVRGQTHSLFRRSVVGRQQRREQARWHRSSS